MVASRRTLRVHRYEHLLGAPHDAADQSTRRGAIEALLTMVTYQVNYKVNYQVTMVNSASIAPRAWWPSGTCPVHASPPGLFCKGKVESILPSTPATIAMPPQGKRYRKGHGHHGHSPPIWAYTEQISVTYLSIVVSFSFFSMNDLFERTMGQARPMPRTSPECWGLSPGRAYAPIVLCEAQNPPPRHQGQTWEDCHTIQRQR